ncbi:MAG: hypothetical protein KGY76_07630 [Candidatus Thermoplasmatota archaeon]|nr:hypothetical protein [Candidatus Thermoplasmatota archaeon]
MCRYEFGDGKCSHPKNVALECVGESNCQFGDEPIKDAVVERKTKKEEEETQQSEKEPEETGCPNTEIGIYCQKYGHFHCAGEENCQTREEYVEHLKEHKEKVEGIKRFEDRN